MTNSAYSSTWQQRKARGDASEARFIAFARKHGYTVTFSARHDRDTSSNVERHFPDFFVVEMAAFVQVKDGRRSGDFPNVIAETDSVAACWQLQAFGNKVFFVWEMPDGSFCGNYLDDLVFTGQISDAARKNGAGTQAVKIDKHTLRKFPFGQVVNAD